MERMAALQCRFWFFAHARVIHHVIVVAYSFLVPLALSSVPAQAAQPEHPNTYPSHTLTLAASCAVCHGTDGHSATGRLGLAGMPAAQFISKLQAYRTGSLPATVMHQHARGLTETEIQALAHYFSAQTPGKTVLEPQPQALEPDHD